MVDEGCYLSCIFTPRSIARSIVLTAILTFLSYIQYGTRSTYMKNKLYRVSKSQFVSVLLPFELEFFHGKRLRAKNVMLICKQKCFISLFKNDVICNSCKYCFGHSVIFTTGANNVPT